MNTTFISILLMSATGALLILCLALLRPLTKNCFSAAWHYHTYMLVVFFLLVPIGAVGGSLLAIIPNESDAEMPNVPVIINDMIAAPQNNTDPVQQQGAIQNPNIPAPAPVETTPIPAPVLTLNVVLSYTPFVWLGGVFLFLVWHGIQFARFRRKIIRTSLPIEDTATIDLLKKAMSNMRIKGNLHLFSNNIVKTPMLVGIFKMRLILPEVEMNNRELSVIFKHELIHYKRRDLWVKSLALLANTIHWFNPAAYRLTKQIDTFCELSCDERVVNDMSMEERQFYGETILNMLCRVVNQHSGVYATLAESKKGIERRLTHMMTVRKKSKHIVLISLITAVLLCFAGCAAASLLNTNGTESFESITDQGIENGDLVVTPPNNPSDNQDDSQYVVDKNGIVGFVKNLSGGSDLVLYNTDDWTYMTIRKLPNVASDNYAAISSDGVYLAYTTWNENFSCRYLIIENNSSGETKTFYQDMPERNEIIDISFLPNSHTLIFIKRDSAFLNYSEIHSLDVGTGYEKTLVKGEAWQCFIAKDKEATAEPFYLKGSGTYLDVKYKKPISENPSDEWNYFLTQDDINEICEYYGEKTKIDFIPQYMYVEISAPRPSSDGTKILYSATLYKDRLPDGSSQWLASATWVYDLNTNKAEILFTMTDDAAINMTEGIEAAAVIEKSKTQQEMLDYYNSVDPLAYIKEPLIN